MRSLRRYAYCLLAVAAATGLSLLGRPYLGIESIPMLYLLAVVLSALYSGLGPAILSAALSVLLVDALFDPPYGLFSPAGVQDLVTLGVFLLIGIIISELGARVRAQVAEARQREKQSAALYLLNQKLGAEAEQSRVLEASERFRNTLLSSLSHDLLTPVTSILGSVTTLLDGDAALDPPTRRDLLENAKEDSMYLARLVGSLLDMTRLEAGVLAPRRDWFSVEDVVGAALPMAEAKGRQIRLNLAPDLPLIPFDFVLIEQVLLNLLDNAFKFSPPDSPIELSAEQKDGVVRLAVADRGPGIPEAERARIFEKFYRLPKNGSVTGIGLGLSICKGIIEAHGGQIWAEGREGGGTCITFTLPATKPEATV